MKIGGVKIISLESFKGKFDLKEVWGNIENGVLLDCQRDLAAQGADLAEQIAVLLEELDQEEELENRISSFYSCNGWDLDGLRQVLKPWSAKSKDHKGNDFYSRNMEIIQDLTERKQIVWDCKKAAFFFLFLLLMLQVRPRAEIEREDALWIQQELEHMSESKKGAEQKGISSRIYPYASGVLYLKEGAIVNEQGKQFSPKEEQIDFFAYTEKLGILAFTKQGEISACTEATIRCEIEDKLKGEKVRIVMVAAYGSIYLLLLEDGQVISNVQDNLEGWKKICWVGAGLNSITAIRSKNRNLLELGSSSKITEFSDVKAAYTWSEGICRYGILKENGTWIMDDKRQVEGVCAANIEREGYLYAIGTDLFFCRFDTEEVLKYPIAAKGVIVEVCKYRSKLYYLIEGEDREQIGSFELDL